MTPTDVIVTGRTYTVDGSTKFVVDLDTVGNTFGIAGTVERNGGTNNFTFNPAVRLADEAVTGATGNPSAIAHVGDSDHDGNDRLARFEFTLPQSTSVTFTTITDCTVQFGTL